MVRSRYEHRPRPTILRREEPARALVLTASHSIIGHILWKYLLQVPGEPMPRQQGALTRLLFLMLIVAFSLQASSQDKLPMKGNEAPASAQAQKPHDNFAPESRSDGWATADATS